jgi:putative membrane protein
MQKKDSVFIPIIISLSIIIPVAVAALMMFSNYLHISSANDFSYLPLFHAILNGTTVILLFCGFVLVKNKKSKLHKYCMVSAFVLSSVFLLSYVFSKLVLDHENTKYLGEYVFTYRFILISHILLSVPVLPLALFSMYRGMTGEITKHKNVVKYTFPVWMYVAITGVLVYIFMSPYY